MGTHLCLVADPVMETMSTNKFFIEATSAQCRAFEKSFLAYQFACVSTLPFRCSTLHDLFIPMVSYIDHSHLKRGLDQCIRCRFDLLLYQEWSSHTALAGIFYKS